jgi:sulfate/thiosulfate transport system permease protein
MGGVAEVSPRGRARRFSPRSAARLRHLSLRGAALAYLGLMVVLPVAAIVTRGYADGFGWLRSALAVPGATAAIRLTLIASAIAAVVNAVVGTLIAYVLVRFRFPGRNLLSTIVDLPIAIPTLVTGLALVAMYGPNAPIGGFLERLGVHVIFAPLGIELALLFITLPFVIRTVQPVLLELDPAEEEAAATLGANGWTTFRRVVLPAITPAIAAGALLTFARATGEFGSIVILSGNITGKTLTAPVFIFQLASQFRPEEAAAVATLLFAIAFVLVLITARLTRPREAGGE